jgi:hypothetical protein
MLDEKKQAKLDLIVEIEGPMGPLVAFNGSYVVVQNGEANSGCQHGSGGR